MQIHNLGITTIETEMEEMSALLVKSYAVSLKPFNWRLAVMENWYFASRYLEPAE